MYVVGDTLPIDELDPGTLLVSGPAMTGKYDLLLDFLVEGATRGDGSLFVTTNEDADSVLADVESRGISDLSSVRLVDCVSEQQSTNAEYPPERVEYVNSPGDLTGLGIGVTEQLRRFYESDTDRVRTAFSSLSTLLMYSDLETVFRFLHVLTGRIDETNGLGMFTIDPETHDAGTVNTLKQLFDGAIEIRSNDGTTELRFVGIPNSPDGWVPVE